MSFKGLHDAIQAAFLCSDMHPREVNAGDRRFDLQFHQRFGDACLATAAAPT